MKQFCHDVYNANQYVKRAVRPKILKPVLLNMQQMFELPRKNLTFMCTHSSILRLLLSYLHHFMCDLNAI